MRTRNFRTIIDNKMVYDTKSGLYLLALEDHEVNMILFALDRFADNCVDAQHRIEGDSEADEIMIDVYEHQINEARYIYKKIRYYWEESILV